MCLINFTVTFSSVKGSVRVCGGLASFFIFASILLCIREFLLSIVRFNHMRNCIRYPKHVAMMTLMDAKANRRDNDQRRRKKSHTSPNEFYSFKSNQHDLCAHAQQRENQRKSEKISSLFSHFAFNVCLFVCATGPHFL